LVPWVELARNQKTYRISSNSQNYFSTLEQDLYLLFSRSGKPTKDNPLPNRFLWLEKPLAVINPINKNKFFINDALSPSDFDALFIKNLRVLTK